MYELVRVVGLPAFLAREAPYFGASMLIAQLFYKFGSFAPELIAFLTTWYLLSWVGATLLRRNRQ
jgi:hypothetical protein